MPPPSDKGGQLSAFRRSSTDNTRLSPAAFQCVDLLFLFPVEVGKLRSVSNWVRVVCSLLAGWEGGARGQCCTEAAERTTKYLITLQWKIQ